MKRARFAVLLAAAAGLMVFLIYTAFGGQLRDFVGPGELREGQKVELNARVTGQIPAKPAAAARSAEGLRFTVVDKTTGAGAVEVVYRGVVPDTFCSGREIVVGGTLKGGTFVATPDSLRAICPTKFQERKGEHPDCGYAPPTKT